MVYNNVSVHIPEDYIIDPEDVIVSESPPSGLPNFLTWITVNRTITGTPTALNIGEYMLSMTVEDDYGHTVTFFFKIVVKRKSLCADSIACYHRCITCFGESLFECNSCLDPFVLYANRCEEQCPDGFYNDTKICLRIFLLLFKYNFRVSRILRQMHWTRQLNPVFKLLSWQLLL